MNLSAILVLVRPDRLDACSAALSALDGVDVHHTDPASGRLILTQEADSVDDEVTGFRRIQAQPDVLAAELVYHWFEEDQSLRSDEDAAAPALDAGAASEPPRGLQ